MIVHRLAYRHQNGDVEGFEGIGFTEQAAVDCALAQIKRKCYFLNQPYDDSRLVVSEDTLSSDELNEVKHDWECSLRY